jgi:hypothetical protein
MKYLDDVIVIETEDEFNRYLEKYNCKDFNELSAVLWYEFGIDIRYQEKR